MNGITIIAFLIVFLVFILFITVVYIKKCNESFKSTVLNKNIKIPHSPEMWNKDIKTRLLSHEPETIRILLRESVHLPRNSVIIDAGSHVGDTGIQIARHLADNRRSDIIIYQIDPNKSKIDFIKKLFNVNNLRNVKIINSGLSNHKGKGKEIRKLHPGAWKIDTSNSENGENKIQINTLDDLISKNVGLIHLDVERMEPEVIEGSWNIILKDKPIIVIEMMGERTKELSDKLLSVGYTIRWSEENNVMFKF